MKCISLLSLAALMPLVPFVLATSAMAAPTDEILADLSRCDRAFFETLQRRAADLATNKQFVKAPAFGYFKVSDRGDPERSVVTFAKPLKLGGMDLTGYFDQLFPLGDNDVFVAWGFVLKAPVADVIKTMQPMLWDKDRLQPDGQMYTRTEIFDAAQAGIGWQKVVTPGGTELQAGAIERVLIIEPYEKDAAFTRFGCSLHGAVTPDVLKAARPDIDAKALKPLR
ncbi:MAG: hypothetical protein QM749_07810 [Aquabacterium sp.]